MQTHYPKTIISLLLLTAYVNLSYAQSTFSTKIVGNKINLDKYIPDEKLLGSDENDNTYYLHVNSTQFAQKTYFIDKFDKNMNLVTTNKLDYNQHSINKINTYLNSFEANGKIYFITIDESTKGKTTVGAVEINKNTLSFGSQPKEIGQTDKSNYAQEMSHYLKASPDSSKFCLFSVTDGAYVANKKDHAIAFDNQLNQLWQADIKYPVEKNTLSIEDYGIDNDGSLNFLVVTGGNANQLSKMGRKNFDCSKASWKILRVKGDETKAFDVKLKSGDISFASIQNTNSQLIVTGFYSEGAGENIKGLFCLRIDSKTGNVIAEQTKTIPEDYIVKKLKPSKSFETWVNWYIEMGNVKCMADGSVMWRAEEVFEMSNQQGLLLRRLDALCVKIDANNSFVYVTKVPKEQLYSTSFHVSPVSDRVFNNTMYLLYQDELDNATVYDAKDIKQWASQNNRTTGLMIAKIENDGTYKKELVVADPTIAYRPASARLFEHGELVVPAVQADPMGKKYYWMAKVALK